MGGFLRNKKLVTIGLTILVFLLGTLFGQERLIREYIEPQIPRLAEEIIKKQDRATENTPYYDVVRIADGDTLTIEQDNTKVTLRLLGIDTPEKDGPFTDQECYGDEATMTITNIIGDEKVRYEFDESSDAYDRYDRALVYLYTEDGVFVNAELVARGAARLYEQNTIHREYNLLKRLSEEARVEGRGLWTACEE